MKVCEVLLFVMSGMLLSAGNAIAANSPAVIPRPVKQEVRPGVFALSKDTTIHAGREGRGAALLLAQQLRSSTGLPLPVDSNTAADTGVVLAVDAAGAEIGPEGYVLEVTPNKVLLRAHTEAGLFYGTQTFLQLLPPKALSAARHLDVEWEAPCVSITDSPRFVWRGLLVDVARHFLSVDDLKKFIDTMALHKFNTLHLHLTDDQGWRIEIKKYPRLTEVGSIRKESPLPGNRNQGDGTPYGPFFYTQAQIRDLVAYAQARHITIVPEIDMPGHMLALLTAYPELSCTGGPFEVRTRWGVEPDVLCVGNTNTIPLMQDILSEVLDLFPSEFIHIGGDEVPRVRWQKCPKCQALMKAEGFTQEAQLQTWFNGHIETFLVGRGRRLIGWDEILEGGLTPEAAVMSWRGVDGGIKAAESGHDVVMSPTSHLYLDYAQSKAPDRLEYIGGYVPLEKVYGFDPMPAGLASDKRQHILGAQGNLWAEYIWTLSDLEYKAFPRAAAVAEMVWTPQPLRDFDSFLLRLPTHLERLDAMQVSHYSTPRGAAPVRQP